MERAGVVTATGTAHLYIENGIIELAHDAFGTRENSRFMVEKGQPKVDVLPAGTLVGNVTKEGADALLSVLKMTAKDVFAKNGGSADVRPYLIEEIVHGGAVETFIDDACFTIGRKIELEAGKPLPVAVVTNDGSNVLSVAEAFFNLIGIFNEKTTPGLGF